MGTAAYGGKGFNGRAEVSDERPVGAASCRQQHNQVSCQPHPSPSIPSMTWKHEPVKPNTWHRTPQHNTQSAFVEPPTGPCHERTGSLCMGLCLWGGRGFAHVCLCTSVSVPVSWCVGGPLEGGCTQHCGTRAYACHALPVLQVLAMSYVQNFVGSDPVGSPCVSPSPPKSPAAEEEEYEDDFENED